MRLKLIGINARYTHSCLALFYVRGELETHLSPCNIDIEQYTINDPYHELLLNIMEGDPDVYLFSAAIWNSDIIVKLINDLARVFPEKPFIVGGPQAEIIGREVACNHCVVIKGEIERINEQFYLDLGQGELKKNYLCLEKRGDFAFPYRGGDFTTHLNNRHIYYESSRGCPFQCTYCLSAEEKGVFYKDVDLVKDELRTILATNPKQVKFIDRTFNDNLPRCIEILKFLAFYKCDTEFHFELAPDRFSDELLDFLESVPVGKFEFEIGVQSTNEETLLAIRRRVDYKKCSYALTRLRKMENIHLHVDLILGLPHEDEQSYLRSFRDVFSLNPHYIQMGLLKILPDTPICNSVEKFCYIHGSAPPYAVYASKWMDHGTVKKLYWFGELVERFFNNRYFVGFWQYMQEVSSDIVAFFLGLLDTCNKNRFFSHAPTQKLLCETLLQSCKYQTDYDLIIEILRYDWLRCGHRFLPEGLDVQEDESSRYIKKRIFDHQVVQRPEQYSKAELTYMFKKGYFLKFSPEALAKLGYGVHDGDNILCFLPEREKSLYKHNRVVAFVLP